MGTLLPKYLLKTEAKLQPEVVPFKLSISNNVWLKSTGHEVRINNVEPLKKFTQLAQKWPFYQRIN